MLVARFSRVRQLGTVNGSVSHSSLAAYQRSLMVAADWQSAPNGLRMRTVSLGNQGDEPTVKGQTVRVEFAARLEDGSEVAHAVKSFKLGHGTVCDAIEEGVVGMRVGDRRKLRAPSYMKRGPLLAQAPRDAVRRSLSIGARCATCVNPFDEEWFNHLCV